MFTGIVEEVGTIQELNLTGQSGKVRIAARKVLEGTNIGDSISVNGICLTVVSMTDASFTADVMAETVRRSSLLACHSGSRVNLERAMAMGGRFGGHIVSGHIDGVGTILSMVREENAIWVRIACDEKIRRLIVEKGSIAIDGISLTVACVEEDSFQVSVIPHTVKETNLFDKRPGDIVNLENDPVAKYVERLIVPYSSDLERTENRSSGLTIEMLEEMEL